MPCIFLRTVPQTKKDVFCGLLTQLTAYLEASGVQVSASARQADFIFTLRDVPVSPLSLRHRRYAIPPRCFSDALLPFADTPIAPSVFLYSDRPTPHVGLVLNTQQGAQWLSRNETALSRAMASGILRFFSLPLRTMRPPCPAQAGRTFALLAAPSMDASPLCTVPKGAYGSVLNAHGIYLIVRFRETVGFVPLDAVQIL